MKPKLLFLSKLLAYSLILFIFRRPLVLAYSWVLKKMISSLNSSYFFSPEIVSFIYAVSLTMIAFVSMVLSTPKVPLKRKAIIFGTGLVLFLMMDFVSIQYIVFPNSVAAVTDGSPAYELYLCSKLLLPVLLWLTMSYSYIEDIFKLSPILNRDNKETQIATEIPSTTCTSRETLE